ncbi:MAG TPA: TraR/DksA C4-type zinc finger protein [Pirellulaceae bacterium]|jgi:RNA polymerase-binding protein DksA
MSADKKNRFRDMLISLRERARGEVNHVVLAIQEEVNVNANTSAAPVHMADIASEAVDADVQVLQNERSILDDINAALARLDDGTFGKCTECGRGISEERLKAIPYASACVECARTEANRSY